MSEFKGTDRTGLYVMVFYMFLTTCNMEEQLNRIESKLNGEDHVVEQTIMDKVQSKRRNLGSNLGSIVEELMEEDEPAVMEEDEPAVITEEEQLSSDANR